MEMSRAWVAKSIDRWPAATARWRIGSRNHSTRRHSRRRVVRALAWAESACHQSRRLLASREQPLWAAQFDPSATFTFQISPPQSRWSYMYWGPQRRAERRHRAGEPGRDATRRRHAAERRTGEPQRRSPSQPARTGQPPGALGGGLPAVARLSTVARRSCVPVAPSQQANGSHPDQPLAQSGVYLN